MSLLIILTIESQGHLILHLEYGDYAEKSLMGLQGEDLMRCAYDKVPGKSAKISHY